MQALQHVMEGNIDAARAVLDQIPEATKTADLKRIELGALTLSDLARDYRGGNRAQRRAAAKTRK